MKYALGVTIVILLMLYPVTARQRPVEEVSVERYPNLQAAITDVGGSPRMVVIPNSQSVATSLTIPRNITIRVTGNGKINLGGGVTLTINGPFDAPLHQVFTGSGVVRWGGQIGIVYPQWWGAALDGAADDTAEIQAAINSFPQTDFLHAGGEVSILGAALISSTLTIQKNSIKLTGTGWGTSSEAPKSGYIKWNGAAGSPMILIKNAYNSGVENIRLIGKSSARPSAGIEYKRENDATTLLHHSFARHIFIGPLFGYDSDDEIQFDTGILMSGGVDGDTNLLEDIHVNRAAVGVDIQNGNASATHFDTLKLTACKIGFRCGTNAIVTNANFGGNALDIYIKTGRRLSLYEVSSEGSSQQAVVEIAGQLYIEKGNFEVTNDIVSSGYILEADQSAIIGLKDFGYKAGPGYKYSPLYKLRIAEGTAGAVYLSGENILGIQQNQIAVVGAISTHRRALVVWSRPPSGPNDPGVNAVNFLTVNEPFDEKRFDVVGALNNFGGPLKVKQIGAPAGLSLTKVGSGSGTTYSYRVSAITADGETPASAAVTISGNARLDSSHYIELTWYPVIGAIGYKVYGRSGSEQLLGIRYAYDIHNLPAQGVVTSFKDDGSVTPSGALPAANTTGNASVAGTLSIGGGIAIAKVLSATAILDFPNTAAQTSADLTITVTGAALGDVVSLGVPHISVVANSSYTAWVSASNRVTVRLNNYSGGAIDPASGTFRAQVTKF